MSEYIGTIPSGQEWSRDIAFHGGDEEISKHKAIAGHFWFMPRKNSWEAHIFYDGYEREDMPNQIMRADLELPVEIFHDASVKDILEYVENALLKDANLNE